MFFSPRLTYIQQRADNLATLLQLTLMNLMQQPATQAENTLTRIVADRPKNIVLH